MNDIVRSLYKRIEAAFNQSDVKKYAEDHHEKWFYCLTSTKLTSNTTVIIGFNGGAKKDCPYRPQNSAEYPNKSFKDLYDMKDELGSFSRIYNCLKQYLPKEDIDNFVQTNFCFFKSNNENEISEKDIRLCIPIFE